jgi:N-acylmannosamine kinase
VTDPSKTVLAIDVGGTKIAFADIEDNRPRNRHQIRTPRTGRGEDLVGAIAKEVSRRRPSRIAVATTGIVSDGCLSALNPGTLSIENGFPLSARIRELTGVTPLIINDAQAAAWGEYRFGAGQGCRNFMFVTVSTGVGGGLVLDGRLDIGGAGLAGHVGHMTVVGGDSASGCGRKGCLETLASGTAIARRFREDSGQVGEAPEIFEAASNGDQLAERILDQAAKALAEAFANIVASVDLDAVALGGGVGLAAGFLDRVRRHISRLPAVFQRQIKPAAAGPDAGLVGVADLVWRKFSSQIES